MHDKLRGSAYEDQYKPTEETKESVIDNYLSRVEQAPIVNAATGFFRCFGFRIVSNLAGACRYVDYGCKLSL